MIRESALTMAKGGLTMTKEKFRAMLSDAFTDFANECEYDQVNFNRFIEWLERWEEKS